MRNAARARCQVRTIFALSFAASIAAGMPACDADESPLPQESSTEELWAAGTGSASSGASLVAPAPSGRSNLVGNGYDRDRARWYIQRYAKEPNQDFDYCGAWAWHGNRPVKEAADCTDFASQVLWYGGIRTTNAGSEESGWWSNGGCRASGSSKSWRQVNRLIDYVLSEGRIGRITTDVSDLRVGDLIFYQLRRKEEGDVCPKEVSFNHTSVVSGFDAGGQPLVSYHSNDALDVPWRAKNGSLGSLGNACRYLLVHIY